MGWGLGKQSLPRSTRIIVPSFSPQRLNALLGEGSGMLILNIVSQHRLLGMGKCAFVIFRLIYSLLIL